MNKRQKMFKTLSQIILQPTSVDDCGFPVYRIRNNEREVTLRDGKVLDNKWVIPYNIDLLIKYQAHINVDKCNCIVQQRLIKYLFKYINMGKYRSKMVIEEFVSRDGVGNDTPIKQVGST